MEHRAPALVLLYLHSWHRAAESWLPLGSSGWSWKGQKPKPQTQCALWQASRANISLLAAPRSIKHPGGCFQAPRLGAGSPHPPWSQAGVPGCKLGWWGAARWRWGAHLQGAGLQLAAEAAWDEGGGHAGQTLGGSIHASKELTATAARGSRLHRQPPSIPNAHFMPTHPIINYCRK